MSECKWTVLPERGVLHVRGSDAQKFLQGVVTNDVEKAGPGHAVFASLLSPQGKIQYDFFVFADGEDYLLDVPGDRLDALNKRLGFYKLRADVEIVPLSDSHQVVFAWGDCALDRFDGIKAPDPRLPGFGSRIILPVGADLSGIEEALEATTADYHTHRIALGVPEGGLDYTYEDSFPHDANFDFLNGVDFEKGCYVGQEVVSRMQHRGTARKRIIRVESDDGALAQGADIVAGDVRIGVIGSAAGMQALARVRVDRLLKAVEAGQDVKAGGVPVRCLPPPYADFGLPS